MAMDEKKRAKLLRVCRVLAIILAAVMVIGIFVQALTF